MRRCWLSHVVSFGFRLIFVSFLTDRRSTSAGLHHVVGVRGHSGCAHGGWGPALTVSSASACCIPACCSWCRGGTVIRSLVGDGPPVVSCRSATGGPPVRARRRSGHRRSRCRSSRVQAGGRGGE